MSLPSAWDAAALVVCLADAIVYGAGLARSWRRAGTGTGVRVWEAAAFAAGWLVLLAALFSPLAAWSQALFAAHMSQHELLMIVAAPLIVLGRPLAVAAWFGPVAVRRRWRMVQQAGVQRVWRELTRPVTALLVHGAVLWIWHLPVLFEAALAHPAVHLVQHLSFFWTAALFWWALVHGRSGALGYGIAVLFVFMTAMHTSVLGALLTFADAPWYPTHAAGAAAHGSAALQDQQLAGALMWVPSGTVFTLIGLALFAAWLGAIEMRQERLTTRAPRPRWRPALQEPNRPRSDNAR